MSAVPEQLMSKQPQNPDPEDKAADTFWQWFAIGVLVFCWLAEATMCAERGF
jgi:hypothetical protein